MMNGMYEYHHDTIMIVEYHKRIIALPWYHIILHGSYDCGNTIAAPIGI